MKQNTLRSGILFLPAILWVCSLLLAFTGCKPEKTEITTPETTVVSVAMGSADYSLLTAAIKRANLTDALSSYVPVTVFAPNNAAFQAAGFDEAKINATEPAALAAILQYHIFSGRREAASFSSAANSSSQVTTTNAKDFYISVKNGVLINGTAIGSSAKVTGNALRATNGIIHPIDKVLLPPTKDITSEVLGNANFSLLRAALAREGTLGNVLKEGRYTLLAPNNAAFQAIGLGTEAAINSFDINTLRSILKYHVVERGRVFFSPDLANQTVKTALVVKQGDEDVVRTVTTLTTGGAKVTDGRGNTASFTAVDLLTTNGVIHTIDKVLLPPL